MYQQRMRPVRGIPERNALVEQWSGLPLKALSRLRNVPSIEHADLLSEGYLGLIRAAELWRPGGKAKFSSYAYTAIWSRMMTWLVQRKKRPRLRLVDPEVLRLLLKRDCWPAFEGLLDVQALLGRLDSRQRGILGEWLEGRSCAEIGRRLGLDRGEVRRIKNRAVDMLRGMKLAGGDS